MINGCMNIIFIKTRNSKTILHYTHYYHDSFHKKNIKGRKGLFGDQYSFGGWTVNIKTAYIAVISSFDVSVFLFNTL